MQVSTSPATNLKGNAINSRTNDMELARAVGNGDSEAIDTLCDTYADKVFRYVGSLARDLSDQDIEEVVQITMTAAVANIDGFQGKSSLGTWLFSLARYKLFDLLRKKQSRNRREVTFSQMPEQWDPTHPDRVEDEIQENEFREQVRKAVNRLPPLEAEVLSLRYMTGLGTDEICKIIGKSERVTQKILTQARSHIRGFLLPLVQNGNE